jgi:hypothetical protein
LHTAVHTLNHQKTLVSNYSSFTNLQGYWKEILHRSFPEKQQLSSSNNSNNNNTQSFEESKKDILEMEDNCAKLLNLLSIQAYRDIFANNFSTNESFSSQEKSAEETFSLWSQQMIVSVSQCLLMFESKS